MAKYFYCCCCRERKKKNPRLKSWQSYCGSKACQQARKNKHERERLKNDPVYYAKRRAQKATWQNKQQGFYHKTYRANHADYTSRNLILQKTRCQKAKTRPSLGDMRKIVKTDALIVALSIHSGFREGLVGNPAPL